MKKLIFGLIVLLPILMSCEEDVDKILQTDLSTEAAELFSISKDWNESLYFAMISWEEYQQLDTIGLSSCPDIILDKITQEVTLNFLSSSDCIQTGIYGRSGKLIIKYDTTLLNPNQSWTMTYDNYTFGSNSIEGIRTFSSDNPLQVAEEFIGLIEKTEKELSTEFSGKFIHTKSFFSDTLVSFTSLGRIKGINAVGRDFEITTDSPVIHNISCYQQNEILPTTGKGNWFVSRGGTSEVSYTVTYESLLEDCKVAVNANLPDGKKLRLNPSE